MLSIEDGAVGSEGEAAEAPGASSSAESVATTQPEQTPEDRVLEVGYAETSIQKENGF